MHEVVKGLPGSIIKYSLKDSQQEEDGSTFSYTTNFYNGEYFLKILAKVCKNRKEK